MRTITTVDNNNEKAFIFILTAITTKNSIYS